MKIILFGLLAALAYAKEVEVISNESVVRHDGQFHYHYELGDGSRAVQDGELKQFANNRLGEAVHGKFAYISDDGKEYAISYTADENGYRPVGAHLPTPPPVPLSVLKTLKYLEEHAHHPPSNGRKHY